MRYLSIPLIALLAACGPSETPSPEDLTGIGQSELAVEGGNGNGNANGHQKGDDDWDEKDLRGNGWHKGWSQGHGHDGHGNGNGHGDGNGQGHRECSFPMDDPFAAEMPARRLDQGFEQEPIGPLAEMYEWHEVAGASLEVTQEQAFEGQRSLKVSAPATAGYHYVGPRFCVRCEAMDQFHASFAIRFESFASWTGLMVTNNPTYAYWWWVRSDGTAFDTATFAQLQPKTWHQVQIAIDRKVDLATITIDGVPHAMPLTGTWYDGAAAQPMGCFRLLLLAKDAQTVYLDKIKVHGLR